MSKKAYQMTTGNITLDSLLAAFIIGAAAAVLYAVCILCYRLCTTQDDIYPTKIKSNAKISTKNKGQGKVVTLVESDAKDAYSEIIDDYPTCYRQDLK